MMAPDLPETKQVRPPVKQHDESPSGITDHPFEPKGEWWTLCMHCNLAQSAHAETKVTIRYVSDDLPDDDED